MNKYYILALDIGTSSVRASIYDENADPMLRMFVKNERSLNVTPDGGAEIDAHVLRAFGDAGGSLAHPRIVGGPG